MQADGFVVTFDRPIDPGTFTTADVQVRYRTTAGTLGAGLTATEVLPIPSTDATFPDFTYNAGNLLGYTKFLVRFPAQAGVGTYSYAVGPTIQDRIRTAVPAVTRAT